MTRGEKWGNIKEYSLLGAAWAAAGCYEEYKMDKQMKQVAAIVFGGIGFYFALTHFQVLAGWIARLLAIFLPVLVGGILAFFLNVPMSGIERGLQRAFASRKKNKRTKWTRPVSLVLTFLCIIAVFAVGVSMLVPELSRSVMAVYEQIQLSLPKLLDWMQQSGIDTGMLEAQLALIDFKELLGQVANSAGTVMGTVMGAVTATVSVFSTALFSLVVAIYILMDKENLSRQCKKLLFAYLRPDDARLILHVCNLTRDIFSKFLSGQVVESLVLGSLMFVALSLARLPYASLIAVLTTVCAFIPYVGAFISCGIGVLLTLMVNPMQAVLCLVVYQVVQFIENQFIYPRVVGSSVGLSALWTIVAVLVGGEAMGILGMIFFIPCTAVIYTLVREGTNRRLERLRAAAAQTPAGPETPDQTPEN